MLASLATEAGCGRPHVRSPREMPPGAPFCGHAQGSATEQRRPFDVRDRAGRRTLERLRDRAASGRARAAAPGRPTDRWNHRCQCRVRGDACQLSRHRRTWPRPRKSLRLTFPEQPAPRPARHIGRTGGPLAQPLTEPPVTFSGFPGEGKPDGPGVRWTWRAEFCLGPRPGPDELEPRKRSRAPVQGQRREGLTHPRCERGHRDAVSCDRAVVPAIECADPVSASVVTHDDPREQPGCSPLDMACWIFPGAGVTVCSWWAWPPTGRRPGSPTALPRSTDESEAVMIQPAWPGVRWRRRAPGPTSRSPTWRRRREVREQARALRRWRAGISGESCGRGADTAT